MNNYPVKLVALGMAWSQDDMIALGCALTGVAMKEGKIEALKLLTAGYQVTMMTEEQFDMLSKAIEAIGKAYDLP